MTGFSLTGPLPSGTVLLEASAGTGKTFTIAGLAVRYIAEAGLDVGELLLITFSNNAAAELRSRLHAFLTSAQVALRQPGAVPDPARSPINHYLVTATDQAQSLARITAALDGFDRATVTTTHAFSQLTLTQLGVLSDADPSDTLSEAAGLIDECAADVYLQRFRHLSNPPIKSRQALELARQACRSTLPLEPADAEETKFARDVRALFEQRKSELGLMTFNDLIERLRLVLADEQLGPKARAWLRGRYTIAFVDEFQDTDKLQWEILQEAFIAEDRTTILIGDPKQSIYGFRDADLESYRSARERSQLATLTTNFRSDPGVVDGIANLFEGLPMGHPEITVTPVEAHHLVRLDAPREDRVHIRRVPKGSGPIESLIRDDLATQVQEILGLQIDGRPVGLDDIAILTRTSRTASAITARLGELGLAAVEFGGSSVWKQPAAADWRRLLESLSHPSGPGRRVVALTDLVGAGVEDLTSQKGAGHVAEVLSLAEQALQERGPSAALEALRTGTQLEARCLPMPSGERYITDLMHISELLDATGKRDPHALLRAMDELSRSGDDGDDVRLVSDESAIKVMTLHKAKGLEFPVVLLPDMSALTTWLKRPFQLSLDTTSIRSLWVSPSDESTPEGRSALAQGRDEEFRLLYVGLTRAKHLAIAWHAQTDAAARGPLSALLFRDRHQPALADSYEWQSAPDIPGVHIVDVASPAPHPHTPAARNTHLGLATFTRTIDPHWRRTSYSGLTSDIHDVPSGADEPADVGTTGGDGAAIITPAPMGTLPAGAAFGTLVHEVLERLDWHPGGLGERVSALVDELAVGFDDDARSLLTSGLEAVVRTPLLPLTNASLSEIPVARRLPELDFDLPMASTAGHTVADLADALDAHLLPDDPLRPYPARLRASAAASARLQGLLTGSIDAVLELDDGSFTVVDYKTNRLAPSADVELTLGHYTPAAMAEAMMGAHYPLQAILYCAALHRFLSKRLPGYSPERHLGGVGYLFVRGMAGPDTPDVDGHRTGVFTWRPSPELVIAVSDLLGGPNA